MDQGYLRILVLQQYVALWSYLHEDKLAPTVDEKFIWKGFADQQYSTSSAYRAFFLGQSAIPMARELSKTKATPKCKFYFWLVLLDISPAMAAQPQGAAALVPYVPRQRKQSSTSCSVVFFRGRYGTDF
jgi:hypothetical protein